MRNKWQGVLISESLIEPSRINSFEVFKAAISRRDLGLGGGKKGRWHLYHVYATDSQVAKLMRQIKPGWYAHFWRGKALTVVFLGRRFLMDTDNKSTWRKAVEYGRSIGIPENELDFPTK